LSRKLAIFTNGTLVDPERLQRLLAEVAEAGLCIADGTFDPEVASIGAPLFGEGGHVVGAAAIAAPRGRAKAERLESLAPKLIEFAKSACQTLGGRYPGCFRPPTGVPKLDQAFGHPPNRGDDP
ncbi:MAG: IclR family transcriptional regulator C-terminal domain-containing protein, partial [Pseudomonadota bacterium]